MRAVASSVPTGADGRPALEDHSKRLVGYWPLTSVAHCQRQVVASRFGGDRELAIHGHNLREGHDDGVTSKNELGGEKVQVGVLA